MEAQMPSDPTMFVLEQIHQHARSELQLYVGWFTFFLTLLLGSMGWSLRASLDRRGRVVAPFPFYCIVVLFSIQLVLSILGTRAVAADLKLADSRSQTLQRTLALLSDREETRTLTDLTVNTNPFPQGMHKAMDLMRITLETNLVFWLVVAALVARRRGRKLIGSAE